MAIAEIPTSNEPNQRQVTDLGGREYEIRIDWRERAGHWALDLRTIDGGAIALGLVLIPGRRLLRRLVQDGVRPEGDLVCTGEGSVGRADLGGIARLYYWDGEDLDALVEAQEQPA